MMDPTIVEMTRWDLNTNSKYEHLHKSLNLQMLTAYSDDFLNRSFSAYERVEKEIERTKSRLTPSPTNHFRKQRQNVLTFVGDN